MQRPECPNCGKLMSHNGFTPGGKKRRYRCKSRAEGHCYSTTDAKAAVKRNRKGDVPKTVIRKTLGKNSRVIVTAAQNATPIHKEFFETLQTAAEHLKAELVVIPLRYKNPTSRWTQSQANAEIWDDAVVPYLFNGRKNLNRNLALLGDIKTQPTAVSPLSGFEGITHNESGILGHTRVQLRTVPTSFTRYPKIMTTTGACTRPNYTDTRQGKLGEFHHTLGAALVELDGGAFHLRQINAKRDTGEFIDLRTHYTPGGIKSAARALGLDMGDMHVGVTDKTVERATFGPDGMVEFFEPEALLWHDLFDGMTVNPHEAANPFAAVARSKSGRWNVRAEVEAAAQFVVDRTPKNCVSIIVPSNHDAFLRRWIETTNWKADPGNAEFYLETALQMVRSARMETGGAAYIDPFIYWMEQLKIANVRCLRPGESCKIGGIETSLHGHEGPNGARGSLQNLSRIGNKVIIGHGHGPGIEGGGWQVGTSTGRLKYQRGPSNHMNTHCSINALEKRCLHNVVDGKYRL